MTLRIGPGACVILLMLAATVYGVVQMVVLAWPTRTVRLPTALLACAVGVYACGAIRRWIKANPDAPKREYDIADNLIKRLNNALRTRRPG